MSYIKRSKRGLPKAKESRLSWENKEGGQVDLYRSNFSDKEKEHDLKFIEYRMGNTQGAGRTGAFGKSKQGC